MNAACFSKFFSPNLIVFQGFFSRGSNQSLSCTIGDFTGPFREFVSKHPRYYMQRLPIIDLYERLSCIARFGRKRSTLSWKCLRLARHLSGAALENGHQKRTATTASCYPLINVSYICGYCFKLPNIQREGTRRAKTQGWNDALSLGWNIWAFGMRGEVQVWGRTSMTLT